MDTIRGQVSTRRDFSTAKDLLEYLLEDERFQPRHIFDATARGVGGLIFRGQRHVTEPLLPSAHRQPNRLSAFTPQWPANRGHVEEKWKTLDRRERSFLLTTWLQAEI